MEKILVVDDSLTQATRLKEILEDEYEVTVAQTAEAALVMAGGQNYSLILLDVVMPGMDGFTLLKKLQEKASTRNVPVILITSLSDTSCEHHGLILGAVDYITKPFDPLIVKARVDTHVKLYNYRRRAERQSLADPLTGLANRRKYDRYSLARWREAARLRLPFSICMADIDHFKLYNDTFGHPAGDRTIIAVADTLSAHLKRSTDFLARYGGEEFVVLSVGDPAEKFFETMCRVREAVEQLQIPHTPEVSQWVTVSLGGLTVVPTAGSSYDSYLKIADMMLYDAKRQGRNRVVWANEQMNQLTAT